MFLRDPTIVFVEEKRKTFYAIMITLSCDSSYCLESWANPNWYTYSSVKKAPYQQLRDFLRAGLKHCGGQQGTTDQDTVGQWSRQQNTQITVKLFHVGKGDCCLLDTKRKKEWLPRVALTHLYRHMYKWVLRAICYSTRVINGRNIMEQKTYLQK